MHPSTGRHISDPFAKCPACIPNQVKSAKEERSLELAAALQEAEARLAAQLKAKLVALLGADPN